MEPRVAVVMITHNRRDEGLAAVERLCRLPEQPEVVVVDNDSADGTAAALRDAFADVRVVALPDNRGAAGRTVGVEAVRTPYVAFADDDCWWDADALTGAADLLDAHPRVAVVNARIIAEPGGRPDPICDELASSPLPVAAAGPRARELPRRGVRRALPAVPRRRRLLTPAPHRRRRGAPRHLPPRGRLLPRLRRRPRRPPQRLDAPRPAPAPQAEHPQHPVVHMAAAPSPRRSWGSAGCRERTPVPRHVEAQLRLLDDDQLRSRARRYVS